MHLKCKIVHFTLHNSYTFLITVLHETCLNQLFQQIPEKVCVSCVDGIGILEPHTSTSDHKQWKSFYNRNADRTGSTVAMIVQCVLDWNTVEQL